MGTRTRIAVPGAVAIAVITASAASAQTPGAAQPAPPPPPTRPVQTKRAVQTLPTEEFEPLIARYYAAWSTRDPDIAASLYSTDATAVFYDLTPLKYIGWEDYREGVSTFLEPFTVLQLVPNPDLKVTRRGSLAWTTVTFRGEAVTKTGERMNLEGRHTAVWEKRGADWLIVHEHVSVPLPPAGEPTDSGGNKTGTPADEESIRSLFSRYQSAWTQGDANALATLWGPEGDVVSLPTGSTTKGRAEVERMWTQTIARRRRNFSGRIESHITSIRFVTPLVAIVDGRFEYWTGAAGRDSLAATERYTAVVSKQNGEWLMSGTRIAAAPAPATK